MSQSVKYLKLPGLKSFHVPFMVAIISTAFYSAATTILYPLSFYFQKQDELHPMGMHPDDYAGYLAYLGMLPFLAIFLIVYIKKNRHLLFTGVPNLKDLGISVILSGVIMSLPWVLLGNFFDLHRFCLPGDGNWPAISVMTIPSITHAYFIVLFMKDIKVSVHIPEAEENQPTQELTS